MMGKPDKALEIYTYGLRTLPSDHPSREVSGILKRTSYLAIYFTKK